MPYPPATLTGAGWIVDPIINPQSGTVSPGLQSSLGAGGYTVQPLVHPSDGQPSTGYGKNLTGAGWVIDPIPYKPFGGTGFSPLSLFANGEQGVLYDMSNAASRFQDSAGTVPVVASGDPFGRILDLSGRGNHAGQATTTSRPQYNLASGLSSALFDGTDDSWQTFANLDLSATDKVTVIAGVRKLSDAGTAVITEFGAAFNTPGSFYIVQTAATVEASAWSTAQIKRSLIPIAAAPTTAVLSSIVDFAQALPTDELTFRINGVVAPGTLTGAGVSGNFGTNTLNIGRRSSGLLPFNGNIYSLIIIGRLLTAPELVNAERWTAQRCGVVLP